MNASDDGYRGAQPVDRLAEGLSSANAAAAAAGVAPLASAEILVVDDNAANLIAIEAALGDLGPRVVRAQSGSEALRLLLDRDFALVLLDVKMPSMDGFETARMIRSRKRSRHTPIVFITAYARDDSQVLAAYALGVVDFLFKPLEPIVLRAKASVFVELQARAAEVARQADQIREHEQREHERLIEQERERWEAEAMRRQMEQLAEADRHKDRFLALLGHELRNPLASITAGLELLRSSFGGEGSAEGFERTRAVLERQTRHLTRLVDDLLDLARVRSGKIELRKSLARVDDLIEQAVHNSRPLLDARKVELSVENAVADCTVNGDPVRLVQVLSNLLNNAARYTPAGGKVRVTAVVKGDSVELRVIDTGRGMSPEFLPHAFDAFRQESQHSDQGLGLGLALVRQVVSLHGGSVSAHSEGIGKGAELRLVLPCEQADADAPTPSPLVSPTPRPSRRRSIVLIDDSEDVRALMAELLESWGHRVEVAPDGESGVELALRCLPDIAFVDIGLPMLDGYGVAARLRAHADGKRLRLVAMTGFGSESDKQRAREVGFDSHIVKPASIEALRKALSFEDAQ